MKASLHPTNKRAIFVRGQTGNEHDVLADFVNGDHTVEVSLEQDPDNPNAKLLVFSPVPQTTPAKAKARTNGNTGSDK